MNNTAGDGPAHVPPYGHRFPLCLGADFRIVKCLRITRFRGKFGVWGSEGVYTYRVERL